MKRIVKAWVAVYKTDGTVLCVYMRKPSERDYQLAIPCTITYDDGTRPKRGKK